MLLSRGVLFSKLYFLIITIELTSSEWNFTHSWLIDIYESFLSRKKHILRSCFKFEPEETSVEFTETIARRCSVRKAVLRHFAKFTGKHLCKSLFFNKVAGLRPATFLKKRLWDRCFPVNFAKFLRTPFLQTTSGGCF